ncbi:uncharacterized protein LOC128860143 isoform X2 [Anastrepha ludens]|uniref:uncharacterized protein LOC128860143 isoform X2 n=1 Tax=Anastrepha ludens TaxID=28586 RepID=UPI0023B1AB3D|nr:uncharacterized protein LOC128860143 isoform X2 [Anastrepha ludens]XP_053953397.1 uncharacterized protein LOC128860143 isoform X2 [Anastrepha ludens]XP_053953398.1 uncharacterized protein LOC128860143 isoform X2 [Anastrepha ludens]XP_053953399.1 uncharacterized protein LOC128860143 isoform X2 [Anastrepha ludens]XP_053953400.1 uncharacterized protein LOC128860143 isoform X2 [Anastrepha ludens]XP_053953401.1 uncharacterized protein LOC128860143 isoform X2 [Anastrepha ludens]
MWLNCWMLTAWAISLIAVVESSWGSPGDGQYHIQTDEGPERYFRFQTDNGQFRKERRLQDGTVVGTEAWIDAAGFLRQKDYIADKDGYRILKSKTVFVGNGRHIEDAIKSAKSAPAQSGVLVNGRSGYANSVSDVEKSKQNLHAYSPTPSKISAPVVVHDPASEAYDGKLNYLSPADAANIEPSGNLGFDHYPDELPRLLQGGQRNVQLQASNGRQVESYDTPPTNSITEYNPDSSHAQSTNTAAVPKVPTLEMQPPLINNGRARQRIRPIAVYDTKPAPISSNEEASGYEYSTPTPFAPATTESVPSTNGYYYQHSPTAPSYTNAAANPLAINQLEGGLLPPLPPPTSRRHRPPAVNSVGEPGEYDGVGVTANGFRYFLPRQYHEEERFEGDKRAGSFGYVDPFGIRRVVYYNASPGRGFVHRNNNRYVGLGAAPYDAAV